MRPHDRAVTPATRDTYRDGIVVLTSDVCAIEFDESCDAFFGDKPDAELAARCRATAPDAALRVDGESVALLEGATSRDGDEARRRGRGSDAAAVPSSRQHQQRQVHVLKCAASELTRASTPEAPRATL